MDSRVEKYLLDSDIITEYSKNCTKMTGDDLKDFCQEIWLILLEYDQQKITEMWENGTLYQWVARIIKNQWNSQTSPYHCKIRRWQYAFVPLEENLGEINKKVMEENNYIIETKKVNGKKC